MNAVTLRNVNKNYGNGEGLVKALKNINLEIKEGEMISIMGPSGSGKTTLLNIIGLLDLPSEGEYYLFNELMKNGKRDNLARIRNKKIGFVFQNFNLLNNYSVLDNVEIPLIYSEDKRNMRERSIKILSKVGLRDYINKNTNQLSGGQKQRVAIARALINEPDIILADEPTGALDKKTGEEIVNLLKDINKIGKTVIIVTHDINIANYCDRIVNIVDGEIV